MEIKTARDLLTSSARGARKAPDTRTSRHTPEVETFSCPVPHAQFCILISRAPYDIRLQRRRFLGGAEVLNNLPEDDGDN